VQSSLNPFFVFTLAVAVSMLLIPLVRRLAPRFGLVDLPDPRKVHTTPVPRVGGWGITIGCLAPLLLSFKLDPLLQSFVLAALVLFLFGVWDDARQLGHWTKFAGQVGAVAIVVLHGDLYVSRLPFLAPDALSPALGKAFTMFAMIGAINAVNHSDGLDGLAAGESLLSLLAIAVLGYVVGDALAVGVAIAAIGGILGFLRYNSYPARVFMGDAGSQVLGFTLAFLVVYLTQVANTAISAALPLLLLGLPIADILSVLFQRIKGGMNWFKASTNHAHHRLLALGFDHYEAVIIIYTVQVALVVGAILLRYESDLAVTGAYCALVGGLFAGLIAAERRGWRLRRGGGRSRVAAAIGAVVRSGALRDGPLLVILSAVPSFMLLGSLWVGTVPHDFAIVAGILAAVVAAEMFRTRAGDSLLVRASVYAAAIFCAYLFVNYPGVGAEPVRFVGQVTVLTLAGAIVIYMRFAAKQEFGTTPTDYLIVFGVLALAVFSGVEVNSRSVVELVALATVLLYGCEVVIALPARSAALHVATLATLAILAVRGALA